jgi:periplasmic protein TonB
MNRPPLLIIGVVLAASLVQPASLRCQNDPSKRPETEIVYRLGRDGVTPPRAIYRVDPTYDDASRKAKISSAVVLTIIVTPDGNPKSIRIAKSLSPSLDQRAIEAVAQWKFAPATKDGKPVAIQVDIQVTYNLF